MGAEDAQSSVVAFLKAQAAHDAHQTNPIEVQETHISIVLLAGSTAWKLKRALRLPYADFSSPERRLAACEHELQLNRRTAPTMYRGVRRITREADGRLTFDGNGELIDAVVEMQRFDEAGLFSQLATEGRLTTPLLTALARHIAEFHSNAAIRVMSGTKNIEAVLSLNERCLEMEAILGASAVNAMRTRLRAALKRHSDRLEARGHEGKIRLCHGDLHLRNICLFEGRPTLFDCIEFNEAIATVDILYDLAFLLMDLWHVGLESEANRVMNRYMDETGEVDGLPLLPFFMALRASIRAQVLATQAATSQRTEALVSEARSYLDLTMELLEPVKAQLLAIGGLSGSGKSTIAALLAHRLGTPPGARILATDRIRKSLAGVSAETRLPPESYTQDASDKVYHALYERTHAILNEGYSVLAEGVFSRIEERQQVRQCAARCAVGFHGIWLDADENTLLNRVADRQSDVSDATPDVVRQQLQRYERPIDWTVISADSTPHNTADFIYQAMSDIDSTLIDAPSWEEAPPGWDWRAQDEDGRWFWYAVEPRLGLGGGVWRSPRRLQQFAGQGAPNPLWHETCQRRPNEDERK